MDKRILPALDNPRHELFAQAIAAGRSAGEAYKAAGFAPRTGRAAIAAASRLKNDVKVKARIAEIQAQGAQAAGVTVEAVVRELARLAFSDIRKVVSWRPEPAAIKRRGIKSGDEAEGGQVMVGRVTVLDSATLDDDAAAAISEVAQGASGTLKVKLHDKGAALDKLSRHLGLYQPVKHEHDMSDPLKELFAAICGTAVRPKDGG